MEKQTSSHKLRNMTEGSIAGHLLAFAFPMFLGSLLQQLYNMVDSWEVGRFVSEAALAAVGIGYPVIFMFTSLFMGLSNGTTVTIAQYYGAGKMERVRDVVDTTYTFFTLAVVPITVVALLIARPVLVLMRVEDADMGEAYLYLMIVSGGLIGTIGYNINSGILQGVGNSRASLLFLGISAVMNIVLDLLFVLQFHWGVAGVAIATIISQFCSWIFGVFYINRNYTAFAIRPFCLRFDKGLFKKIMGIGLPAGIQFATASFFTDSQGAIRGAALLLQCILPFYPFFAVQFTMCSVMRGAGESVVPMLTVVTSQVLLRIPGVYLLAHFFGPDYMYYGFGIGWIFGSIATVLYFLSGRWKRRGSLAE